MRRSAIFKSLQQMSEKLVDFFIRMSEQAENPALQFGIMNTDAASGNFIAVADEIIMPAVDLFRSAVQQMQIIFPGLSKRMMHGFPAVLLFVPVQQREIHDKGKFQFIGID